jgi:hypothetical protein
MFCILASVSSESAISAQKTSIFMQWWSSPVHNLPTDDLWSSLLRNFTCWYCPYTFVIFAVTLFPRLARSPYLIFFTCFQLRLAVPIPKIFDRTKQASFPSTLVLDSIQVWCQQHATTKSLFPAAYHIVSLFRMPVWFTNFLVLIN